MKKNLRGFALITALGICALITAAFFVLLGLKSIIDKEIYTLSLKHAVSIAEDTLRTKIALAIENPAYLAADVEALALQMKSLQIPISGTHCGDHPCILSVKHDVPSDFHVETDTSVTPHRNFLIYHMAYEKSGNKISNVAGIQVRISLPLDSEMAVNNPLKAGALECPLSSPIFMGTEIVKTNGVSTLQAICRSMSMGANSTYKCSSPAAGGVGSACSQAVVECNVSQGYWLTGIDSEVNAECSHFPEGTKIEAGELKLCPATQYPRGFELSNEFKLVYAVCTDKGGAYDFQK